MDREEIIADQFQTEIIAFCSGKGGTGKTLMASCLGYALTRGGHNVLMIDADPATDGLSLFLLGPKGMQQIESFTPENTFTGLLRKHQQSGDMHPEVRSIHRMGTDDHGVTYKAIISGRGLYGDVKISSESAVPDLDRTTFRAGLKSLFDSVRLQGVYDYILVDTRGGFAFESTDVCSLADSFILVTDPDITSFYQDRNLVQRISHAAGEMHSSAVLRAIIVNKGTDIQPGDPKAYLSNIEVSFRNELTKEFPVRYSDTHAVPADFEALLAYKSQNVPYLKSPGSFFSFATLSAFSDILQVVTSRWTDEQVSKWNDLVRIVSAAMEQRLRREKTQEEEQTKCAAEVMRLRTVVEEREHGLARAEKELHRIEALYDREIKRTDTLIAKSSRPSDSFESSEVSEISEVMPKQRDRGKSRSSLVWRIGAALVLVVGLGVLGLLYQFHKSTPPAPAAVAPVGSDVPHNPTTAASSSPTVSAPDQPVRSTSSLPVSFSSTYVKFETAEPHEWRDSGTGSWIEYYSGQISNVYDVEGASTLHGCSGLVLRKRLEPTTEIFIPSIGCSRTLSYRMKGGDWSELGSIQQASAYPSKSTPKP